MNLKYIIERGEKYIKQKGIIYGIIILFYKCVSRSITKMYLHFFKKLSINKKILFFYSDTDFSDNARALSDYIERRKEYQNYEIYWAVKDVKKCQEKYKNTKVIFIPKYRNSLNELSKDAIKIHMKANYIIVTHGFLLPYIWKKDEQTYIMLWHGCGYKDKENRNIENKGIRNFDFALVPGSLFVKSKAKFWQIPEKFLLPMGQPRYNWMLKMNEKALEYAEKLKGNNEKVVIWMPTFRNAKKKGIIMPEYPEDTIKQFPLLKNKSDWKKMDDYCSKNKICLLIKLHIFQKEYPIDFSEFTHILMITNDDIEKNGIQLYEFLTVTDALITDYSSVAFDYLLLDKPIGFVLDDFELYKSTRGFIFDDPLEYMPGHHIYTSIHLQDFLGDVVKGNDLYQNARSKVKEQAIHISDDYCKEILDYLNV